MSLRARLLLVLAGLAVAGLVVANVVTYAAPPKRISVGILG